jgi:hypothetical protein
VHTPLQTESPLVVHIQAPAEHVWSVGHYMLSESGHSPWQRRLTLLPHFPQLLLSVWRFVHAPLQRESPLVVHTQAPAEHVEPVGHYILSESGHSPWQRKKYTIAAFSTVTLVSLEVCACAIAAELTRQALLQHKLAIHNREISEVVSPGCRIRHSCSGWLLGWCRLRCSRTHLVRTIPITLAMKAPPLVELTYRSAAYATVARAGI